MTNKLKIAPSVLAADFTRLGEEVRAAEQAGADWIHFDVMDGRFVPNISIGVPVLQALRGATSLPIDVHLMIVEPDQYIPIFAEAGANSISVHVEACPHLHRTLVSIAQAGCRVGVAINPHTPAIMLQEVMPLLDIINVMTVDPGFGGQSFLDGSLSKIAQLRAMAQAVGRDIDIEVDGGINTETTPRAVEAGANVLIAGTTIFRHKEGIQAGVDALRAAASQGANSTS